MRGGRFSACAVLRLLRYDDDAVTVVAVRVVVLDADDMVMVMMLM